MHGEEERLRLPVRIAEEARPVAGDEERHDPDDAGIAKETAR